MSLPKIDTAWVNVVWNFSEQVHVFRQSEACYECGLVEWKPHHMSPHNTLHLRDVDTKFGTNITLRCASNLTANVCSYLFRSSQQLGVYLLNVTDCHSRDNCTLQQLHHPENPFKPILWAFVVYFGLFLLWLLGNTIYKYRCRTSELERALISDLGSPDEEPHVSSEESLMSSPQKKRLRSLDAFRGICIVLMMFVEYGGGKYYVFEHSPWNGLTIADLVFPWFMFVMGVSAALSIQLQLRKAVPKRKIFAKILKRSVLLILLGFVLNTKDGCDFNTIRIMGVLQRFGITYFIVATMELIITCVPDPYQVSSSRWEIIKDIRFSWIQWILMSCFVVLHETLTFALKVPNCPRGYLGPGGESNYGSDVNCTGGAAGYIDRKVLTESHMYNSNNFKKIYNTDMHYDPEGILGTLTATFMVFLGLQAGKILVLFVNHKARVSRWIAWSAILGVIGAVLCLGEANGGWIPVNKRLWSLSFVLVLACFAYILLALCYVMIDMKRIWTGAPFIYPGMNAIALYIGLEFTKGVFPFGWTTCEYHGCYLAMALWGTTLWVIISIYMHSINFFVSI